MTRLRALLTIIVSMAAVAASAQTSFVVDRIEVLPGVRVHAEIVRAESRLVAGKSYTKDDLDQALYRIRRLPFVIDAGYTLAAGNTPDSRVVQFNVVSQHAFNYLGDIQAVSFHSHGGAHIGGFLGYSFFPGATGVLDLTAGGSTFASSQTTTGTPGNFALRYSAYGLFGTSAYAAAGVSSTRTRSSGSRQFEPSVTFGIPLGLTQTFRATYIGTSTGSESPTITSAEWVMDRTDDPYFARRGLMLVAGPQRTKQRFINDFNVGTRFYFHSDQTITRNGLSASAENFRPLAKHSTLWGSVLVSRFDESNLLNGKKLPKVNETNADLLIGLAHNFDGGTGGGDLFNRARVEVGAGYRLQNRDYQAYKQHDKGFEANGGVAYRSEWGVIHLSISYVAN